MIARAAVEELGKVGFATGAIEGVLPIAWTTAALLIGGPIIFEQFARDDADDRSRRTMHREARYHRCVLAHVIDGHAGTQFAFGNGLENFKGADRWIGDR